MNMEMSKDLLKQGDAQERISTPNEGVEQILSRLEALISEFETRMVAEHNRIYPHAFWANPDVPEEEGPVAKVEQMDDDQRVAVLASLMRNGVDVLGDTGAGPVLGTIAELNKTLVENQKAYENQLEEYENKQKEPDAQLEADKEQLDAYAKKVEAIQRRWAAITGPDAFGSA